MGIVLSFFPGNPGYFPIAHQLKNIWNKLVDRFRKYQPAWPGLLRNKYAQNLPSHVGIEFIDICPKRLIEC